MNLRITYSMGRACSSIPPPQPPMILKVEQDGRMAGQDSEPRYYLQHGAGVLKHTTFTAPKGSQGQKTPQDSWYGW